LFSAKPNSVKKDDIKKEIKITNFNNWQLPGIELLEER
jgi:hypothetical protein